MQPVHVSHEDGTSFTFTDGLKPVAQVKSGQRIIVHTLDAFSNKLTKPDDDIGKVGSRPFVNPVTGPIFIEEAQPGDALHVTIEAIEPARDFAVTALLPNFGGLTRTASLPLMHPPLPSKIRIMPIRNKLVFFDEKIVLPYEPFIGSIGVAPQGESISSLVPDHYGGNMDCVETSPGNTLVLPVLVPGAHFFIGDAHATQGDGEITGVAAEMPAHITLVINLVKNKAPAWPRIYNDDWLMATGSARPLEDAARIAWKELIDWMVQDYGFTSTTAYELLGQVGRMRLGNMVDPQYTMVAKIQRKYLKTT